MLTVHPAVIDLATWTNLVLVMSEGDGLSFPRFSVLALLSCAFCCSNLFAGMVILAEAAEEAGMWRLAAFTSDTTHKQRHGSSSTAGNNGWQKSLDCT
jgi:hypothetical protein